MDKVIELAKSLPQPCHFTSPSYILNEDIEIVWEEENSVASINESVPRQLALLSQTPSQEIWVDAKPPTSPPKKLLEYETGASDVAGNTHVFQRLFQTNRFQKETIPDRICRQRKIFLEDFQSRPIQLSPKTRRKRDEMSDLAHERARKRSSKLAGAIQRRIAFEECDSSSIGSESGCSTDQRLKRVDDFIERQQFLERQRQVLRQMREFCEYGAIRVSQRR